MQRTTDDYDKKLEISKNEFINMVKTKQFTFPFKRYAYTTEEILAKIELLRKYCFEDRIMYKEFTLRNVLPFTINSNNSPGFTYLNKSMVLTSRESDYENFNILSDIFQEEFRMKARVYSHSESPWDYFHNNPGVLYQKTLEKYSSITPRNVRETLWTLTREATSFRPTNIIAIIQLFSSTKVLDFCAGWGDRLIGAIAANVIYTGVDPNPALHKGYRKMIKLFAKTPENYSVIEDIAQNANYPYDDYDLIFTSPPYFDLEVYIPPGAPGEEKQSIFTSKTESAWFNNFLIPAIKRAYSCLAKNGKMVININQKNKHENYVKNMIIHVLRECKGSSYLGVIGYSNERHTENVQPMWVFAK